MDKAPLAASALVFVQVVGVGFYLFEWEKQTDTELLVGKCVSGVCVGIPAWEAYAVGMWIITLLVGMAAFVKWLLKVPARTPSP